MDHNLEEGSNAPWLSFLESRPVTDRTREQYRAIVEEFLTWCRSQRLPTVEDSEVDHALVTWMNAEFCKGQRAWRGEKLIAGLIYLVAEFGRLGHRSAPRSLRCLKGWHKLAPSHAWVPLPWAVRAALAVALVSMGHTCLAIMVLLMDEGYLRPGEALALAGRNFLQPTALAVDS